MYTSASVEDRFDHVLFVVFSFRKIITVTGKNGRVAYQERVGRNAKMVECRVQ